MPTARPSRQIPASVTWGALRQEPLRDRGVHRDADRHRLLVQHHAVGVAGRDVVVGRAPSGMTPRNIMQPGMRCNT